MDTQSHHRASPMRSAQRVDFRRTLIRVMSLWNSRQVGLLRRQSVECGIADVTTRLWIEVKSPDEGFTKNGGAVDIKPSSVFQYYSTECESSPLRRGGWFWPASVETTDSRSVHARSDGMSESELHITKREYRRRHRYPTEIFSGHADFGGNSSNSDWLSHWGTEYGGDGHDSQSVSSVSASEHRYSRLTAHQGGRMNHRVVKFESWPSLS